MRSVIKFLNAQSIASIEIHRQLYYQSFPESFPLLVQQNCHGSPVVEENCAPDGCQSNTPEHKGKHMESALTIVVHLFLHIKKFLSSQRQRFQKDREVEMSITQWFQLVASLDDVSGCSAPACRQQESIIFERKICVIAGIQTTDLQFSVLAP